MMCLDGISTTAEGFHTQKSFTRGKTSAVVFMMKMRSLWGMLQGDMTAAFQYLQGGHGGDKSQALYRCEWQEGKRHCS